MNEELQARLTAWEDRSPQRDVQASRKAAKGSRDLTLARLFLAAALTVLALAIVTGLMG